MDPAQTECPRCGAVAWQIHRLSFHRALKAWLWGTSLDPMSWPRTEAICSRCGYRPGLAGIRPYGVLTATKPLGWWRFPDLLLRVVIRRRRVHLPRFFYVGAAAIGALIGAAFDLAFGWPWWAPALGAPIALWLWVTIPAMRPSRGTRTLWNDALSRVNPKRSRDAERQRFFRIVRSPPFPLYGLSAEWTGFRFAGGHGEGSEGVNSISLGHGDSFDPSAPQAQIESERLRIPLPREYRLRYEADTLWHVADPAPPPGLDAEGFRLGVREREHEFRERPLPEVRTIAIPVDRSPTDFELIVEGSQWVAMTELHDVTVTVRARNIAVEDVELVRVTDLEPYIEGSRRLDEKSWQEDDS